jgi:hypothetical protein
MNLILKRRVAHNRGIGFSQLWVDLDLLKITTRLQVPINAFVPDSYTYGAD